MGLPGFLSYLHLRAEEPPQVILTMAVPLPESEFITVLHLSFLPRCLVSIFPSSRDNIANLIKFLFYSMKGFFLFDIEK